jgi:hypothetical protein
VGSNKCPNCGLVNFAGAEVCKRCQTLLTVGSSEPITTAAGYEDERPHYRDGPSEYYPQSGPYSLGTENRSSYRWVVKALLASVVLFFLTVAAVFMWTLITTGVSDFSKGWSGEFSSAQYEQIGRRTSYIFWAELVIVWIFFYRRRND